MGFFNSSYCTSYLLKADIFQFHDYGERIHVLMRDLYTDFFQPFCSKYINVSVLLLSSCLHKQFFTISLYHHACKLQGLQFRE